MSDSMTWSSTRPLRLHLVAAARPNFMKIAPLWHALVAAPDFAPLLVHTGQHYDANMSDVFFRDLGLPEPDHHLGVGGGGHGEQTGRVMIAYEKVCLEGQPDLVVVAGDVNATVACSLVAAKLHIPVAHLEAGLRSGDRTMPEEINRIVTDAISDILWTPSPDGDANLRAEGVPAARISRVGNIMIDSLERMRTAIEAAGMPEKLGLAAGGYGIVTLHRPANVDSPEALGGLVDALVEASRHLPLLFPVHPRTRARLEATGLDRRLSGAPGIRPVEPVGYVPFMSLVFSARLAITDSGGLQEESTYIGLPCLTLRPNTERPVTVSDGTNRLLDAGGLVDAVESVLAGNWPTGRRPELWDGATAGRVVEDLRRRFFGAK